MTRGQFVRLFLSSDNSAAASAVIAGAKALSLHISATVENVSTKDTDDDWVKNEVTGINYDISTNALVDAGETITSAVAGKDLSALVSIYEDGEPVKWEIANVSGDNQRTKGASICGGSAVISQLTINAQNRQTATYDCQLQGHGALT